MPPRHEDTMTTNRKRRASASLEADVGEVSAASRKPPLKRRRSATLSKTENSQTEGTSSANEVDTSFNFLSSPPQRQTPEENEKDVGRMGKTSEEEQQSQMLTRSMDHPMTQSRAGDLTSSSSASKKSDQRRQSLLPRVSTLSPSSSRSSSSSSAATAASTIKNKASASAVATATKTPTQAQLPLHMNQALEPTDSLWMTTNPLSLKKKMVVLMNRNIEMSSILIVLVLALLAGSRHLLLLLSSQQASSLSSSSSMFRLMSASSDSWVGVKVQASWEDVSDVSTTLLNEVSDDSHNYEPLLSSNLPRQNYSSSSSPSSTSYLPTHFVLFSSSQASANSSMYMRPTLHILSPQEKEELSEQLSKLMFSGSTSQATYTGDSEGVEQEQEGDGEGDGEGGGDEDEDGDGKGIFENTDVARVIGEVEEEAVSLLRLEDAKFNLVRAVRRRWFRHDGIVVKMKKRQTQFCAVTSLCNM